MTSEDQKTRQKRTLLMLTVVITSGVLVATSEIIYTEISEYLQMLWSYKMEHGISFIGILSVFLPYHWMTTLCVAAMPIFS